MGWARKAVPGMAALVAMLVFASSAAADEYLAGGGFEGGTTVIQNPGTPSESQGILHPDWSESDNIFASPICSTATCPPGATVGQRAGQNWALFGAYEGPEEHTQTLSQTMTLPAVEGGVLSFYILVAEFKRESSLDVEFDGQRIRFFREKELLALAPGYQQLAVPVAAGGLVAAGPHTVTLQFVSDEITTGTAPKPATTLSVDDVSFAATPVPATEIQKPREPFLPIETKITKVQLYTAKAGKSGSPKNPRRPSLYKATQGKTGKAAKAKFKFTGSGGEGGLTFECKLDDAAYRPCTSPRFYKKLKLGQHTFQVRAVDRAGNRDETPARYEFKAKQGSSGKTK